MKKGACKQAIKELYKMLDFVERAYAAKTRAGVEKAMENAPLTTFTYSQYHIAKTERATELRARQRVAAENAVLHAIRSEYEGDPAPTVALMIPIQAAILEKME